MIEILASIGHGVLGIERIRCGRWQAKNADLISATAT
jgi:hypothetical protein